MNENAMGTESMPRLLAKMSIPMIIAMVVNGLYFLADAAFVGWGVGPDALAALASGLPIDMFITALASMIGIGTASIVSRALGEQKRDRAAEAIRSAALVSIVVAAAVSLLLLVYKHGILSTFGAKGRVLAHASAYYSVMIPGYVLVFLSFLGVNSVRAEGNSRLAAAAMLTGAILNVVLDALFILSMRMGTAGAAMGTVIARAVTVILYLMYYGARKSVVPVCGGCWRIRGADAYRILVLGFGAFTNQLSYSILTAAMNILLKRYDSDGGLSVYGIISRIQVFYLMPFMGLAQGMQPIVGYNYGAKNMERVALAVRITAIYALILGVFLSSFLILTPGGVLGLFTSEAKVIQAGARALRISSLLMPLVGLQTLAYFYFMSTFKPVRAIAVSLFRQVVFIIPLLILLPRFFGSIGLWIAYPAADLLTIIACAAMVHASIQSTKK